MSKGSIRVDVSAWPIVVHAAVGRPSPEQIDAYILEAEAVLARHEPHVVILDTSGLEEASAYARHRGAEWRSANEADLARYCLGTAYVVASPFMRLVLMMTLLLTRLPTPYRVCETVDEAMSWARQRMA
jgi:hypothetical protein